MTEQHGRPEMDAYLAATREAGFHRRRARLLVKALRSALEEARDMLPYVPEYIREKWQYDETLATLRATLDELADDRVPPAAPRAAPEPEPDDESEDELLAPVAVETPGDG